MQSFLRAAQKQEQRQRFQRKSAAQLLQRLVLKPPAGHVATALRSAHAFLPAGELAMTAMLLTLSVMIGACTKGIAACVITVVMMMTMMGMVTAAARLRCVLQLLEAVLLRAPAALVAAALAPKLMLCSKKCALLGAAALQLGEQAQAPRLPRLQPRWLPLMRPATTRRSRRCKPCAHASWAARKHWARGKQTRSHGLKRSSRSSKAPCRRLRLLLLLLRALSVVQARARAPVPLRQQQPQPVPLGRKAPQALLEAATTARSCSRTAPTMQLTLALRGWRRACGSHGTSTMRTEAAQAQAQALVLVALAALSVMVTLLM